MQTKWTLMGFVVLMFATTVVLAQTTTSPTLSTDQKSGYSAMSQSQTAGVDLCRGSSIIGAKVINAQGEDLGKIHEIVLNQQRDQIGYAVLAHGGVAGVGEKMIAIPWSEFQVQSATTASPSGRSGGAYGTQDSMSERSGLSGAGQSPGAQVGDRSTSQYGTEQQHGQMSQQHKSQRLAWNRDMDIQLTLPVSKDSLGRVQGFDKDAWPDQASANWQQQTSAQQQTTMSDAQQTQFDTRKLSKIIGMKVESTTPITFRETSSTAQDSREQARSSAAQDSTSGRTEIGKIKDCVLNSDNGRLIYGVVSLSEISGHTREMSVVPWEAIRVDQQQQICLLQVTSGDSLLAFTFQQNQQPDLADRNYLERVYTAFNVEPQWEALGFVAPSGSQSGRQQPGMQQQRRYQQQQQQQQQRQQQQRQGGQSSGE